MVLVYVNTFFLEKNSKDKLILKSLPELISNLKLYGCEQFTLTFFLDKTCPSTPSVVDGTYMVDGYKDSAEAGVLFINRCEINWYDFWNGPNE